MDAAISDLDLKSSSILEVKNLSIGYDEVLASGTNLTINPGEIISIIGPSGIGKTTLLRTIAGLVKPLSGAVQCGISKRGGIGYIPQRLGLVRHASVYHNVSLGARAGTPFRSRHDDVDGFLWSRRKNRVITAIDAVGLTDKMREPVRRLSGGQQRRVATARTLAQQPELILADEFLGELDERNVQIVVDAVKSLVERGSSMIMVEHHEYRAIELSNRVWRIKDGRLIEEVLT